MKTTKVFAIVCSIINLWNSFYRKEVMKMSEIIITKENFEAEVINSDKPVLVDFWATWCGPCMMLAPVIEEIANELSGEIKVGKVNVDEEGELAVKFGIASIPTLMVFKNGQVTNTAVGYRAKDEIVNMLK